MISRADTAKMLGISLVTLTDWVKRGLPRHKQRGRVYFLKSEILDYLKKDTGGKTQKI
ncbi:MAG: helix-turn-helix domain-containing protein [Chitinophagaceae bacterium]|nr:helix-turn-helix domain-containing protein [Chitinophagaceae bacterium]